MSEVRAIMKIFARMVVEAAHQLGVIYIPALDAAKWPFLKKGKKVYTDPALPAGLRTRIVGGDLFTAGRIFQQLEQYCDSEGSPAWDLRRYDGTQETPDFTAWDHTDEQILSAHGYTDRTTKNYLRVRPLVVEGLTNREISSRTGIGQRTVESVAGSVRAAFRMRIERDARPSPTDEGGEGQPRCPQMTEKQI